MHQHQHLRFSNLRSKGRLIKVVLVYSFMANLMTTYQVCKPHSLTKEQEEWSAFVHHIRIQVSDFGKENGCPKHGLP